MPRRLTCSTNPEQFEAHQDDVNAVAFADESPNLFFSGSDDCLCKVWDRRTLSSTRAVPVGGFMGHDGGVTFIDSKVNGHGSPRIASVSSKKMIWDGWSPDCTDNRWGFFLSFVTGRWALLYFSGQG